MNYSNYLVENIFDKIRSKRSIDQEKQQSINELKKKRIRYLKYQQSGGRLSFNNFENKELRQYEQDHNRNKKLYPNFKTWKQLHLKEEREKAEIENTKSKTRKRLAQAEHEESIAKINKEKVKRLRFNSGY